MEWSDEGVEGSFRYLNKVYRLLTEKKITDKADKKQTSKMHRTIKEVTESFESFKFNNGIIALMELTHYLSNFGEINKKVAENLVIMLVPFVPHLSEELWEKLGNKAFCSLQKWPSFDKKKIDIKLEAAESVIHKTIADITNVLKLIDIEKPKKITLIVSPKWKYKFMKIFKKEIEKTRDVKALMSVCMVGDLKQYGKDISKMIPALLKDASKVPSEVLSQDIEFKNLEESKEFISKEFDCEVSIEKAEESKEDKARNAFPSKLAIVVSS